ncbi:AAA family ATPase [Williamsia sp.]|uniref:AAA family ATPase n=1 Tax=Williamsia sp. TaxID=1872085 RepID=UPI002F93CCB4
MSLTLVIGPPAGGKSTWCREQAGPDDVIIDYDLIALAISPPRDSSDHEHSPAVKTITKAARKAAIDKALTLARDTDVYVIHSTPSRQLLDRYRMKGARIVTIDPGRETVMRRAKRERPWWMQQVIKQWYDDQAANDPSIADRGMALPTTAGAAGQRSATTPPPANALGW